MKKSYNFLFNVAIISVISFLFLVNPVFSQNEDAVKKTVQKPVSDMFASGMLIENATIVNPRKGGFELIVNHRFGTIQNGWEDIFGIYAPSNIYMGVNYGITDRISIGFATEKNNKLQEFHLKWNIIQQARSGGSPVAISYYGNFAIDAHNKDFFGKEGSFSSRLSYFNQLIFARKFSDRFSFQFAPSYTHFNQVDTIYEHDALGLAFGGRFKLWNDNAFILDYSVPITVKAFKDSENEPKPNLGMGMEFVTGTHVFQVFVTNFSQLVSQKNYLYNQNKFNKEGILFGFNILIRLN